MQGSSQYDDFKGTCKVPKLQLGGPCALCECHMPCNTCLKRMSLWCKSVIQFHGQAPHAALVSTLGSGDIGESKHKQWTHVMNPTILHSSCGNVTWNLPNTMWHKPLGWVPTVNQNDCLVPSCIHRNSNQLKVFTSCLPKPASPLPRRSCRRSSPKKAISYAIACGRKHVVTSLAAWKKG